MSAGALMYENLMLGAGRESERLLKVCSGNLTRQSQVVVRRGRTWLLLIIILAR